MNREKNYTRTSRTVQVITEQPPQKYNLAVLLSSMKAVPAQPKVFLCHILSHTTEKKKPLSPFCNDRNGLRGNSDSSSHLHESSALVPPFYL